MWSLKTKAELMHEVRLSRVDGRPMKRRVGGNIAKNRTAEREQCVNQARFISSHPSPSLLLPRYHFVQIITE